MIFSETLIRVELYTSELVEIIFFGVKPGLSLPLHNHPYINGFMKHVLGTGTIYEYSYDSSFNTYGTHYGAVFETGDIINSTKERPIHVEASDLGTLVYFEPQMCNWHMVRADEKKGHFATRL